MSEGQPAPKRRRRRRASEGAGPRPADLPPPGDSPAPADSPAPPGGFPRPTPSPGSGPAKRRRTGTERRTGGASGGAERGMRDLVGSGRSALGVEGALRSRDVNRPTDEDLAEAERETQIVRRNWRPRPDGPDRPA